MLLALLVLGATSAITQLAIVPGFQATFRVLMLALVIIAIAYGLSRTRHHVTGALLAVLTTSVASFASLETNPEDLIALFFPALSVLLASLLLPWRVAAWLAGINIAGTLVVAATHPTLAPALRAGSVVFLTILSGLVLLSVRLLDTARLHRQAQEAARAREVFLTVASHELRTPLTPLRLRVQQLLALARSEQGREVAVATLVQELAAAERQTRRLGALVDDIVEVSWLEHARPPLDLEEADLCALVREAVEQCRDRLTAAGCALVLRLDEVIPGRWDGPRLVRAIGHVLGNALKFGGGRPIEIDVRAQGDRACVTVRDHGIGIASHDQARILDPFERAVSERHFGGLGLGLYLCRQVVAAHGGALSVESRPGAGATFTLELPRNVRR